MADLRLAGLRPTLLNWRDRLAAGSVGAWPLDDRIDSAWLPPFAAIGALAAARMGQPAVHVAALTLCNHQVPFLVAENESGRALAGGTP